MLTLRITPLTANTSRTLTLTRRRQFWSWPAAKSNIEQKVEARHQRSRDPQAGLTTPAPDEAADKKSQSPFYFEAGYAGWAKRPSRPFPPPFFSPPSGSFSDPLSTHHRSKDRRHAKVDGQMIRGVTNGDDAMLAGESLICTNDGVGQWAQRERGHAPLWSRLIAHFWAVAAEEDMYGGKKDPNPVQYLEEAYARTKEALSEPNEWHGTTTSTSALLHYSQEGDAAQPLLYVTQLGDCKVLVVRPADSSVQFATKEQYHYFDCPRQLGTNSPDTPTQNAVMDKVNIAEDDIVLAMSDGVTDNLWEEEISDYAVQALKEWEEKYQGNEDSIQFAERMKFVAQEIVIAARKIAEDPFAASPFMEKAVDEGLAIEGGKLDDISVVAAVCKRRKG